MACVHVDDLAYDHHRENGGMIVPRLREFVTSINNNHNDDDNDEDNDDVVRESVTSINIDHDDDVDEQLQTSVETSGSIMSK